MFHITYNFSWQRLWAMISKEFNQLKRDYTTFAIIIGIPLMQLILFGYAINNDAKHLPTAVIIADHSPFVRDLLYGLENTQYFRFNYIAANEAEANDLLATGKVQFILTIPVNFTHDLLRHHHPSALLEADATDPIGIANAIAAARVLLTRIFNPEFKGSLTGLKSTPAAASLAIHARYNPTSITQYNVVPGLLGVILTMTLVIVTSMAITKERERGTLENLLTTPVQPLEVILGKTIPYIMVGYIQAGLIVLLAYYLFAVPIHGSLILLILLTFPFILANLLVGILFSTISQNQLQASQMSTLFFLPSLLLSGFAFPFRGMPEWAQWLGQLLPLTHYINICRGIMLKGNGWIQTWPELWPILLFMLAAAMLAVSRYKQTLD